MHASLQPKDITLYRRIAKDVPEIVFGDPTRLRQVLVNLLSNRHAASSRPCHVRVVIQTHECGDL